MRFEKADSYDYDYEVKFIDGHYLGTAFYRIKFTPMELSLGIDKHAIGIIHQHHCEAMNLSIHSVIGVFKKG